MQEEVPPGIYYAHYKNVEKLAVHGKFVPNAGLDISGIAGTGSDKEEEEAKPPMDEEMKDVSKKDGGEYKTNFCRFLFILFLFLPVPIPGNFRLHAISSKITKFSLIVS